MTENKKIELFDKWYDENYDEWAEGEEGIALREELEQAFKSGIEALEKENAELQEELKDANEKVVHLACNQNKDLKRKINKAKVFIRSLKSLIEDVCDINYLSKDNTRLLVEAEQFLSEVENV